MDEAGVGWIAAIFIGGLAGWLAEMFMKSNQGVLMNIILESWAPLSPTCCWVSSAWPWEDGLAT